MWDGGGEGWARDVSDGDSASPIRVPFSDMRRRGVSQ